MPSGATRGTVALAIRLTRDEDYSWAAALMEEYENRILMRTNSVDMQDDIGGGVIIAMADLALAADKKPSLDIISLLLKMIESFEADGDANNCNNYSLITKYIHTYVPKKYFTLSKI